MVNVFGQEVVRKFEDYEKFEEFKLPWGSCVGHTGYAYAEFERSSMDAINYIRRTSEPVTIEDIKKDMPVIEQDRTYKLIMSNIENVRLINLGEWRKECHGYLGEASHAAELVKDTAYGLVDVVFYIEYNRALHRFEPHFNKSALNFEIPEQKRVKFLTTPLPYVEYDEDNVDLVLDTLTSINFFDRLEFIPLIVSSSDGVRVSHKKYRDRFGYPVDAVTSPTLGMNIMNHPEVMDKLSDWLASGSKINPYNVYLILQDRENRDKYYLRRYNKKEEAK